MVTKAHRGQVEAAVRRELDYYRTSHPALYATAAALGELLDGNAMTSKPGAARQLRGILADLEQSSVRPSGRLAAVRAMTRGGGA
jgi:hypothetical protein